MKLSDSIALHEKLIMSYLGCKNTGELTKTECQILAVKFTFEHV